MNKIYNSWVFIISVIALVFTYVVNLNETYGIFPRLDFLEEESSVKYTFYQVIALLLLLINGRRSYKRWTGMKVVNQLHRFRFNTLISEDRKRTVVLNNTIEMVGFFVFGMAFLLLSAYAQLVTLVFFIAILETIIFTVYGLKANKFRIGMTKKAIVSADREVLPIYFSGLKRITKQNNILYFEYINDLVLDLNLRNFPETEVEMFEEELKEVINKDKVYFSGFEPEV